MELDEIMSKLAELGTEQTKTTFSRHGANEPLYGVKIGDLKKLVKFVKKDQMLAEALYNTGNSDAMYLAGLSVNPRLMSKEALQDWVKKANWYMLAEYTVAGVAAESAYAVELAKEWMASEEEMIATCGWSTYANYISMTPDEDLDIDEIRRHLELVRTSIHQAMNRVRYTMNAFVITVGVSVRALHEEAGRIAEQIGIVQVNMGDTACKVPVAAAYIEKVVSMDRIGLKKKTCIC